MQGTVLGVINESQVRKMAPYSQGYMSGKDGKPKNKHLQCIVK